MKKKKTNKSYNYKNLTIFFDLNLSEEKEMLDWLETNKTTKNGYSVQIKRIIKQYIKNSVAKEGSNV